MPKGIVVACRFAETEEGPNLRSLHPRRAALGQQECALPRRKEHLTIGRFASWLSTTTAPRG